MSKYAFTRLLSGVSTVISLSACDLAAQTLPFGECRLGYWSSTRNLDNAEDVGQALCFVNWKPAISEHTSFNLNVQAHETNHNDVTGDRFNPREAYFSIEYDQWSVRVGRQIIAWGRADRINPTDYFSARDFTLLVPEDEDQRKGINSLQVQYNFTDETTFAVVLARFEDHRIPTGQLPPNLTLEAEPDDAEYAFKIDHTGEQFDWSLSYFHGYDRFLRFVPEVSSPSPFLRGYYPVAKSIGLDFATAFSCWTARGEISHSQLNHTDIDQLTENDRGVTRATFGMDRDFFDAANINIQMFFIDRNYPLASSTLTLPIPFSAGIDRLNSDYDSFEKGFTLRISNRFMNDRLKFELSAISDINHGSYLIRSRGYFSMNDSVKITLGWDNFSGKQQSYFGSRKKNNTAFTELTYIF
ncbi:hypothetical protein [Cellvibrio sp. OA-2007]|uniref:hypothetical protein n=1 Tax=Cellvibrio sp. OA-2007 TaxID=529823 RepID=UPI000A8E9DFD|nr:hypothetical protein [Cellvibrio sp. OA-2007]